MKKFLTTALAAIMMLSITAPVFATGETHKSLERTTVKVGYLEDYGIIDTPITQGAEGYGYEYLEKLEEYTDYDFQYVSLSWAEGMEQLKDGEIDLLAPASMSEERKEVYDFVDAVFSHEETNVYALENSTYNYDEPEQLNGKVFGTMEGSVYADRFQVYAEEHDLEYTLKYTDPSTVVEDINSGKIDLYVDGSLHLRDGVHSIDNVYEENLYLMTRKGNVSLKDTLNAALVDLEADDGYYNELLWYKYYADVHKATRKLSRDEITVLQRKDVYTVGYRTDLHPISYTLDGEPRGYAVEVMNLLANKLGIHIRYVPLYDETGNRAENVDFNLSPIRDESTTYGVLSEPYDIQNLLVVKNKNLMESEVQNILVPDYATIQIENFLQPYTSATIHKIDSSADIQRITDSVDIDCKIIPESSELFIRDKATVSISVLDVSLPIGITVSSELPIEVLTALNKTIHSLKESTVDEIVLKSVLELQTDPTFLDTLKQYQYPILAVFLLVAAVFVYILWNSRKKTKRLLEVDTLTGLMTKYKFEKEARRILATANPDEYVMIVLDVDKFKTINKVYGTKVGDKLLCVLSDSLKRNTRKSTIVGRIQSDTFAIMGKTKALPEIPMDDLFAKELKKAGIDMTVYCSIGAYLIGNTTDDISLMLDNARTAKGYGKAIFGNTIHYFTKEMQAKHEKENAILSSMETGLGDEEFFIVVQPKVELQTERLVGGEVLIRWKKKDDTFGYPDEFIPLMEDNKFIVHLDHYVLKKTCEYIRNSKLTLPVLSVNVSATTMLEPDFIQYGLDILDHYGVIPQQIEIELTENVLDYDFKYMTKTISELKQAGFYIAVDDFGKGASSLARIKEIEMDVLKLDKEFIAANSENDKGKMVLGNIISMANDLGITSLAEGIETKEQKDMLIQIGCQQGQGYYFDRPLSTMDFTQRVEANSKIAFEPVIRYQKDNRFWADSKDLPYGVAVSKNDQYATVIHANDAFYDIIGYTKERFQTKYNNRFVSVLVDNLVNLILKYLEDKHYNFSFDVRVLTGSNEVIWVHEIVKYDPVDDLFFITIIKVADQTHLKDSTIAHSDFLQEREQVSEELEKALHKLRNHYDADRAFFVQLSNEDCLITNYQEVLQTGVVGKKDQLQFVQNEFMRILAAHLKKGNTVHIDVASLKEDPAYQALVQNFENNHIESVMYTPIKDMDDNFWGFVGLDNPKQNLTSVQLLEIDSSYIGAYLVQNKFKELANQNLVQEESSKVGIVNLCINMLRTTTTTTTTAAATTVLELLREHYDAKSCIIIHFSHENQTFEIRYMNIELDAYPHWDVIDTFTYRMIEKAVDLFEENKYALLKCNTLDFVDTEERAKYRMLGIEDGYLAPMFDIDNNCNGILVVTNPKLTTRSPMLVQIVSKFLSDYQVKYDIYLQQQGKMAIEPMTGLLNKVATEEKIEALLQAGQMGALYMVDVDNFKQVNDKLGHAMGDEVIVDNAQMLRKIFRKEDIVGRIGGDEFIVYAPELITDEAISRKAEQIVETFTKTYEANGIQVHISASVGVCASYVHGETFQHLYQEADKALYRAKAQGKNQYHIFAK